MSDGYQILTLDEVETASHRGSNLIPVRHALGFRPAGVNAWKADTGGELGPPHSEDPGMEELYVVVRGHAAFTVDEETADAPSGTLVFVPPEVHRRAVAAEDGTIVFVVGGEVGGKFRSSGWGNAIRDNVIAQGSHLWGAYYDAGCIEASRVRRGSEEARDAAFEYLRRAKELDTEGESTGYFREDSDLDSLRDDPRFQELLR